jgi:hypothetical protein
VRQALVLVVSTGHYCAVWCSTVRMEVGRRNFSQAVQLRDCVNGFWRLATPPCPHQAINNCSRN